MVIAPHRLSEEKTMLAKPLLPQPLNSFRIKQILFTLQYGDKKKECGYTSTRKRHGIYRRQCLKMQSIAPLFIGSRGPVRTPAIFWVTYGLRWAHLIPAKKFSNKINGSHTEFYLT